MPDPRVLHFWDAGRFVGPWFAKTVNGQAGYMWDAYLLYVGCLPPIRPECDLGSDTWIATRHWRDNY
jgi:hypothetical protein